VQDGDIHDYLGMIMEHDRESKTVRINMTKYILEIIEAFSKEKPEERLKMVTTQQLIICLEQDKMLKNYPNEERESIIQQLLSYYLWPKEQDQIFYWQCHS
ncbi:MAG: hypothetical protein ACK53Y_20125, partial [bacterium]